MPNEITSILQPLTQRHRAPEQTNGAVRPSEFAKPGIAQGDRVSLSETARQLHLAESGSVRSSKPGSDNSGQVTAATEVQGPSPAMANMMEAFFTTTDMDGFDTNSDLNADGVINFLDFAALRAKETSAESEPPASPKALFSNMTDAFLSSEGTQDFDAVSDLNDDGTINFLDLGILRAKMQNSQGQGLSASASETMDRFLRSSRNSTP